MLRNLSWPTLEQRRKSARLSMMSKITNKLAKVHSPELQLQAQSLARRGHEQCYRQCSCRTEHRGTSFFPRTEGPEQPSSRDSSGRHPWHLHEPPHLNKALSPPSPSSILLLSLCLSLSLLPLFDQSRRVPECSAEKWIKWRLYVLFLQQVCTTECLFVRATHRLVQCK